MIRSGIGAVLAILFPLAAALGEEVRFSAGETRFAVDLPDGYCDVVQRGSTTGGAMQRELSTIRARGLDLKVLAVPCDRADDLLGHVRNGGAVRALAFGFLTMDGELLPSEDGGGAYWRAFVDSTRYLMVFSSNDVVRGLVQDMVAQRDIPVEITEVLLSTSRHELGAVVSGKGVEPARPDGFNVAAVLEPYAKLFLVTSVVELGTVQTGNLTLKDARDLNWALRKVE